MADDILTARNVYLSRLLEKAGLDAAARDTAERVLAVLTEELHHRMKNVGASAPHANARHHAASRCRHQPTHGRLNEAQFYQARLMRLGNCFAAESRRNKHQ